MNEVLSHFMGMKPGHVIHKMGEGEQCLALTGGNYNQLDWTEAMIQRAGTPANVVLCSWSASAKEAERLKAWRDKGWAQDIRIIADKSLEKRQKRAYEVMIDAVGMENIFFMEMHAKFSLVHGPDLRIASLMSGNMSGAPCAEFYLADTSYMYDGLMDLVDRVWSLKLEDGPIIRQLANIEGRQKHVDIKLSTEVALA